MLKQKKIVLLMQDIAKMRRKSLKQSLEKNLVPAYWDEPIDFSDLLREAPDLTESIAFISRMIADLDRLRESKRAAPEKAEALLAEAHEQLLDIFEEHKIERLRAA